MQKKLKSKFLVILFMVLAEFVEIAGKGPGYLKILDETQNSEKNERHVA